MPPFRPSQIRSWKPRFSERKSMGFTLMEMLVVMVIVSILLAAAAGGLGGRNAKAEKVGLRAMSGVLEKARLRAISRGTYVAAVFPDGAAEDEGKRFRGAAVVDLEVDQGAGSGIGAFVGGQVTGGFEELPQGQVLFGQSGGARSVVDGGRVPVKWRTSGGVETLPAVVFTPTGSVLLPSGRAEMVVRVASGVVDGGEVALREDFDEKKHGRVEIQRVTGKILRID